MDLELPAPAFLNLKHPKTQQLIKVDVYLARKKLIDFDKSPDEETKWNRVLAYIGDLLELDADDRLNLAFNQAIKFNNAVMELVEEHNKELAKANFPTAS